MNKNIVITLLILTICIGCTSNNSKNITYIIDKNYCTSNTVSCEDVEMQYSMNKLNVSKKASCLSKYDYENINEYLYKLTQGGDDSENIESSTVLKIDCESKKIHIDSYIFSSVTKTWSVYV